MEPTKNTVVIYSYDTRGINYVHNTGGTYETRLEWSGNETISITCNAQLSDVEHLPTLLVSVHTDQCVWVKIFDLN